MRGFYAWFMLLLFCVSSLLSTAGEEMGVSDLLFFKNHFSVSTGITQSVLYNKHSSSKQLSLIGLPGTYVGFKFTGNICKSFAIITGLDAGVQTYQYQFNSGSINYSNAGFEPYAAIPLLLNPRINIRNKYVIGFQAGASLYYYAPTAYNALVNNAQLTGKDELNLSYKMVKKNPYLQPELGVSYGIVLKNLNIISLDVKYSIGLQSFVSGSYIWHNVDVVKATGTIEAKNSFVNIGFSYAFTKAGHLKQGLHDNKLDAIDKE